MKNWTVRFQKKVAKLYRWSSIDAMLKEIPLESVMPWLSSVEEMKKVYVSFPGYEEKIREYGLLGLSSRTSDSPRFGRFGIIDL